MNLTEDQQKTLRVLPSVSTQRQALEKIHEEMAEAGLEILRYQQGRTQNLAKVAQELGDVLVSIWALESVYPEVGGLVREHAGLKLGALKQQHQDSDAWKGAWSTIGGVGGA